jgi:uncharacterized protein
MNELRGKTALVTGASAGIGREMTRVLGREVGALVLVARRRERLDELARELVAARPGLRVLVRAVDLLDRKALGAMLDDLAQAGENVDVLVNNAGFGDYGLLEKREWEKIERMLELNVVSTTMLLARLVPPMVARGSGAILNVGSIAGILPSPAMSTYAASKAYVNHLSEGLRAELAGTGVSVTVVCPGPVPTEFQEVAGSDARPELPQAVYVDAVTCAEEAVAGLKRGQARVIPGILPRAMAMTVDALPKAIVRPFLSRMGKKARGGR